LCPRTFIGSFRRLQTLQYVFLSKDLTIANGALTLFVFGGGRFSVDNMLVGKS
jgi:uncharacterized membrane protein YphA (DoxX/SURF4 family)